MKNLFSLIILLLVFGYDKPETSNFEIIDFEKIEDCEIIYKTEFLGN